MRFLLLAVTLTVFMPLSYAENTNAPVFTLADDENTDITFPRKHNGVDIYLFWASWCPYCKALMPHLQSMQIEYGDDIKVFAFNIRDDEANWFYFEEKGFDFTLMPEADPIMGLYGVQATPALFLVDSSGVIRFNLYELIFNDNAEFKAMSHSAKAGRRAPNWSAKIRLKIDEILAEAKQK